MFFSIHWFPKETMSGSERASMPTSSRFIFVKTSVRNLLDAPGKILPHNVSDFVTRAPVVCALFGFALHVCWWHLSCCFSNQPRHSGHGPNEHILTADAVGCLSTFLEIFLLSLSLSYSSCTCYYTWVALDIRPSSDLYQADFVIGILQCYSYVCGAYAAQNFTPLWSITSNIDRCCKPVCAFSVVLILRYHCAQSS